jgi:hypothetical protein
VTATKEPTSPKRDVMTEHNLSLAIAISILCTLYTAALVLGFVEYVQRRKA